MNSTIEGRDSRFQDEGMGKGVGDGEGGEVLDMVVGR